MWRVSFHIGVIVGLTLLSQLGGVAWLLALAFRRRFFAFVTLYSALTLAALWVAPLMGRVPLSCLGDGALRVHSFGYCALNRNYVVPELKQVLEDTAREVNVQFPGTVTLVLDAGFPFGDGFPLLPHLSHSDGRKADLALYYQSDGTYRPGNARSPVGYFAFEQGPTDCPQAWPTLRWNLQALQGLWRDMQLDTDRTRAALSALTQDSRVGKIFIEPHLGTRLGITHPKMRFQGCRAARHDDHIQLQL